MKFIILFYDLFHIFSNGLLYLLKIINNFEIEIINRRKLMMTSQVPFLGDYKKNFLKNRFLTSALGGIKITADFPIPIYIIFVQVLLFLLPCLSGGLFTFIYFQLSLDIHLSAGLHCLFLLILCVSLHFYKFLKKRKAKDKIVPFKRKFFEEEDEFEFDGFGEETLEFLIPNREKTYILIIEFIFFVIVNYFTFIFNCSDNLKSDNHMIIISVISWIVNSLTVYPLIFRTPQEVSVLESNDQLTPFFRSFYVLIITITHYFKR